jgi:CBS domain-containing protein
VTPETPLHEAAEHMARRWIRHLPVVEGERVVGMVSQRDLVGVLASSGENLDQQAGEDLVRARRLARLDRGDLG